MNGTHFSSTNLRRFAEEILRHKSDVINGILREMASPLTRIIDVTLTGDWLTIKGVQYDCRANIADMGTWATEIDDGWICMNTFEFCPAVSANLRDVMRAIRSDNKFHSARSSDGRAFGS